MPYRSSARVELENITSYDAKATLSANVSPWKWYDNTLYFHASWRQENGLETNKGLDYDMASLSGRGVFKGDVLSLYNWCPRWYGEGDEHIWSMANRSPRISDAGRRIITIPPMPRSMFTIFVRRGTP